MVQSMKLTAMKILLVFACILLVKDNRVSCEEHEVGKMLHFLLGDSEDGSPRYDKTLRPNFGGDYVTIGIEINVDSLGPIDEVNKNFRVDMSLRQYWKDPRLNFSQYQDDFQYNKTLALSYDFLKKIWVPDLYFPGSLSASKHNVMVPNVKITLSPDGSILYSSRITVIGKCTTDLDEYSMETYICSLIVDTYGYSPNDLSLLWHGDRVTMPSNIQVAHFTNVSHTIHYAIESYFDLGVTFEFARAALP
jgi:hypothetical protein